MEYDGSLIKEGFCYFYVISYQFIPTFFFGFKVLFSTERIGIGMGKTRKDAQLQAAENALRNLESKKHFICFIISLI